MERLERWDSEVAVPGASTPGVRYVAVRVKSLLRQQPQEDGGWHWRLDPYEGCQFGCLACPVRLDREDGARWREHESKVAVKVNAAQVLRAELHVRALGEFPFFKVILITNATGLDLPEVQAALEHFTGKDEVWAKLDGGTQEYLNKVNGAEVPLAKIMANLKTLGCRRPLVIQSLFPALDEHEPPLDEIAQYAQRLSELQQAGAQISLVQIYSATRPVHNPSCGHLPLKSLSGIAQLVRRATGLRVEVY